MNPDLRPLRDIHDALGNPWWPLAPGWWLLLALVVGLVALIWYYRRARPVLPAIPLLRIGDWRWDARRELQRLSRASPHESLKSRLAELSELLKRIAMARHGRSACAGLHGQAWLDWLSAQDPDGFDWSLEGQLLVRAPYAPEVSRSAIAAVAETKPEHDLERQFEQLIAASERWIAVQPKAPRARSGTAEGQPLDPARGTLSTAVGQLTSAIGKRRPPAKTA